MKFDLFQYLAAIAFIYIYGRIGIHIVPGIGRYFINDSWNYQKRIEKPRILFNLVGLAFMHLMYFYNMTDENQNILIQVIMLAAFASGFLLCCSSWNEKFTDTFQAQKITRTKINSNSFKINASDSQIEKLYNELVKYDLLLNDRTSFQDFKNVLTKSWDKHNSRIHLNMDGPSSREFYDCLIRTFPLNSLTLKSFFSSSKLILRPDGKSYKYNTIKNAPTRTTVSKHHDTLITIFNKIEMK